VPASVAVVIATADNAERLAGLIGPDALASTAVEPPAIVVPDPDAPGRRATIQGAIEDAMPAALGPAVPVQDAPLSAIRARRAVELVSAGALPGDRLLICDEHLLTMLIHRDERLLIDLRRRALAPLETLTPRVRTRLLATLVAFLEHEGRMDPTARALGVHPQTVRYRVAQLRDLLGSTMDDPEGRLMLQIALRDRGDG
jgi:sugar diacid utilization regulator